MTKTIISFKSNSIFSNILIFFCFINYRNSFYVFNLFKNLNTYCSFLIFMQNNKFNILIYKILFLYLKCNIILTLNNINKYNFFSIFNFFFANKTYSLNKWYKLYLNKFTPTNFKKSNSMFFSYFRNSTIKIPLKSFNQKYIHINSRSTLPTLLRNNAFKYYFLKKINLIKTSKNFKQFSNLLRCYKILFNNSFKTSLLNYISYSNFFFYELNKSFFHYLKKNPDVFAISITDELNSHFVRLSSNSLNLNNFFFLMLRISIKAQHANYELVNTFNNICNVSFILIENFFFLSSLKINKKFEKFLNIYLFYKKLNLNKTLSILSNKTNKSKLNLIFWNNTKLTNYFYTYKIIKHTDKNFNFFQFNKLKLLLAIFFKPLFFKFFFYNNSTINKSTLLNTNFFKNYFFYSTNDSIFSSNLLPNFSFNYLFKKHMLRLVDSIKFSSITSLWHYSVLTRFLEYCSGKKVYLRFFVFLNNKLDMYEKTQCLLWSQRVKYYRKVLGPRLFLNESLQIIYLALKYKDPHLLSNWIISTIQKISFWKFKTFLRYIKYVLRYFFWSIFSQLNMQGIKFQLKGKISVAGNSRTRTAYHYVGFTSHATFNNKILYKLSLVRTFTGVQGFKLWLVF